MKTGGPRRKGGRNVRNGHAATDGSQASGEESRSRVHWHIIGFTILLIVALSFLNFRSLPDVHAPHLHLPRVNLNFLNEEGSRHTNAEPSAEPSAWARGREQRDEAQVHESDKPSRALEFDSPRASGASGVSDGFHQPVRQVPKERAEPGAGIRAGYESAHPEFDDPKALPVAQPVVQPGVQPVQAPVPHQAASGAATFEGDAWLELHQSTDNAEMMFGAWMFLPDVPPESFPSSSESMKTVAATKISGCGRTGDGAADGWAVFVHEWGTTNRQLRLSWTTGSCACNELYSSERLVPLNRWVHVGFSFSKARQSARLYLGGQLIADTVTGLGRFAQKSQDRMSDAMHAAGERVVRAGGGWLYLGAHAPQQGEDGGAHVFLGFIGDFRLHHESFASPDEELQALAHAGAGVVSAGALGTQAAIVARLAEGRPVENSLDGSRFVPVGGTLSVGPWSEQPRHPLLLLGGGEEAAAGEPGPRLNAEELRATWPAEWLRHFDEATLEQSQQEAYDHADQVREAMRHAWRGYRTKAWGKDELKPGSGHHKSWCDMAITMIDALSTLWLMGLRAEFEEAEAWLEAHPVPSPGKHGLNSLFETTIRGLAGLLSAYSLSGRQVFLDNAVRLGDAFMPAFRTQNGLPMSQVDVGTGEAAWHTWVSHAILSEVGTLQVEFRYLSHATGDPKYAEVGDKAFDAILQAANGHGLVPIYLTTAGEIPRVAGSKISMGACGDSYFEYLLKLWIQTGKSETRFKDEWKKSMAEMHDQMVVTTSGGLLYIAELENGRQRHRMDHLACFVAGMLIMGSRTMPANEVDPRWEQTAAELTRTCHEMYARSPTGLSPEYVVFHQEQSSNDMEIPNDAPHNLLRPEAIEAMYYMHYYTGDPKYRRWAKDMLDAFLKYTKAKYGFSSVRDVRHKPPKQNDSMESFFLAETLKYLYLIFAPRSALSLEEYVLNTEAHPLKVWAQV